MDSWGNGSSKSLGQQTQPGCLFVNPSGKHPSSLFPSPSPLLSQLFSFHSPLSSFHLRPPSPLVSFSVLRFPCWILLTLQTQIHFSFFDLLRLCFSSQLSCLSCQSNSFWSSLSSSWPVYEMQSLWPRKKSSTELGFQNKSEFQNKWSGLKWIKMDGSRVHIFLKKIVGSRKRLGTHFFGNPRSRENCFESSVQTWCILNGPYLKLQQSQV